MAYKSKLKDILRKEEALQEEKQELLRSIVFTQIFSVYKIPRTEEELFELMKKVLNKNKCSWLDLKIVDLFHKNLFIFGRERFILGNLGKIVKIIKTDRGCKMGDVGISFSAVTKFHLENFI